jgi:hypothetical protein
MSQTPRSSKVITQINIVDACSAAAIIREQVTLVSGLIDLVRHRIELAESVDDVEAAFLAMSTMVDQSLDLIDTGAEQVQVSLGRLELA